MGPSQRPLKSLGLNLAAKAEDALDVACQTTLALLLHLVIQRWECHVVECQVKEQGLAGDWLEVRREVDKIGLLADKRRVKVEGLQMVTEGLNRVREREKT